MTDRCTLVVSWVPAVCTVAVSREFQVLGQHQAEAQANQRSILPGVPDGLPGMVAGALARAGLGLADIERIVVVTGPGSFTALRTAVAYAHGLSLSLAVPIVGVSVGDSLRAAAGAPGETWFVGRDRLGRLLLDRGAGVQALAAGDLPMPAGPVTLVGAAAAEAAAHLRAHGSCVRVIDGAEPSVADILLAADLMRGEARSRPVGPLYVEAPAVTANDGRGRPPPVP